MGRGAISRWRLRTTLGSAPPTRLGRILGRSTGSFFSMLKRMVAEGLLDIDTPEPTRGTQYSLTRAGRTAVSDALAADNEPGLLTVGQYLLLVREPASLRKISAVLADNALAGSVAWVAELGSDWLIALDPTSSDPWPLDRLRGALEDQGMECRRLPLVALRTGRQMRQRAADIVRPLASAGGG